MALSLGPANARAKWAPCRGEQLRERHWRLVVRASASSGETLQAALAVKQLSLRFGAKNIPHPLKESYGGEDAHFVSAVAGGAFGVADGVGGWQESGINPADYSRSLMEKAQAYLEVRLAAPPPAAPDAAEAASAGGVDASADWLDGLAAAGGAGASTSYASVASLDEVPDPTNRPGSLALRALDAAHSATRLPGSATAIVARLDATAGTLDAANLGDSGLLLLRGGRVAFRTRVLQHYFDCPYQLGAAPEYTPATDSADDADVFSLPLLPGDVLVMGSDGLLDNAYDEELAALAPADAAQVEQAAAAMAELAFRNSNDPGYDSPYSREAVQEGVDLPIWEKLMRTSFEGGKLQLGRLQGGKPDDITVVVAYVEEAQAAPQETAG